MEKVSSYGILFCLSFEYVFILRLGMSQTSQIWIFWHDADFTHFPSIHHNLKKISDRIELL